MRLVRGERPRLEPERPRRPTVLRFPFPESDAAIVAALRAGERAGGLALYDRHAPYVRRVLVRVLGPDAEIHDLIQDVFVIAIDAIERLEEPNALRAWLAGISVHRAREEIRKRTRNRWFPLFPVSELPPIEAPAHAPEVSAALRATYRVLVKLAPDERIPFSLRFIEGMELVEVADACRVSLATVKRRLARARKKFESIARTLPELSDWIGGEET